MIGGHILGTEAVQGRFTIITQEIVTRVRLAVKVQGLELLRLVKQKLSDDVLHVRTGRLRRSINERSTDDGHTFTSTTGTNVRYGAYWERGFTRKVGAGARGGPKSIRSVLAMEKYRALHPPGVKHFPPRSFLRSSLADRKTEIRAGLTIAMKGGLGK